jgi:HEPN domain-containing protein
MNLAAIRNRKRIEIIAKLREAMRRVGCEVFLRWLTRMNIETRYPIADQDDVPFQLYGKEEAWQAVEACERILAFVRGLILRDEHSKGG